MLLSCLVHKGLEERPNHFPHSLPRCTNRWGDRMRELEGACVCKRVCAREREREREIKWWRARENPVVCVYCVCVCMCKGLMVTVSTSYGPSHWHVNPNPGDYARTLFSPPPRMTVHVKCTWEIHYRIPTLVKSYRTIRYLSVWMNQRQIEILTISALISP